MVILQLFIADSDALGVVAYYENADATRGAPHQINFQLGGMIVVLDCWYEQLQIWGVGKTPPKIDQNEQNEGLEGLDWLGGWLHPGVYYHDLG